MPLPTTVLTGSMIAATAMTAAGLNLGVMGIGATDQAVEPVATEVAAASAESVQLLALPVAEPEAAAPAAEIEAAEAAPAAGGAAANAGSEAQVENSPDDDDEAYEAYEAEGRESEYDETDDDQSEVYDEAEDGALEKSAAVPKDTNSTTTRPPSTTTSARPTTTQGTTTANRPVDPTVAPVPPAPVTEYLTYEFKGVADMIIAIHDGRRLEFWSAIPAPGWAFLVEDDLGSTVKLKFRPVDGGDEAEWELKLENGQLKLKQEY